MMFKHHIGDVPKPISDLFQTNNNITVIVHVTHNLFELLLVNRSNLSNIHLLWILLYCNTVYQIKYYLHMISIVNLYVPLQFDNVKSSFHSILINACMYVFCSQLSKLRVSDSYNE